MGQLCCDRLGQPPLAPGQTGKEALAPAKANGKAAPAPAGTEAAVLLALGRIEEQMGRLEKQQALLLEAQEGHYEDVEELEGTVEQAIEEGTSILDNLEAGSQQARSTMENVFAVAKAARDTGLVLLGFGGLGLLLWPMHRQRPPRQQQRKNRTQSQQRAHRQLQHQRKPRQRLAFERWGSAATKGLGVHFERWNRQL